MKNIIIVFTIILGFFILGQRQCSKGLKPSIKVERKQNLHPTTPAPVVPATTPPQPVVANGWKFDYQGTDYQWFVPTTPPTEPTAWLNLDHNFNYRQRIKEDCIVEYADASGAKKSMLYVVGSQQTYLKGDDGVISTTPWDLKEYSQYRLTTTSIRFIPFQGKPLALKMGRKE